MMRPLCIVQARMGSTRLPGKVMMEVKGKPLIWYLTERFTLSVDRGYVDNYIFALPAIARQDALGSYLLQRCHPNRVIFAEEEMNVAGRFAAVLARFPCDTFIRICADSPLLDPAVVDAAVTLYQPPYFQLHCSVGSVEVVDTGEFLRGLPKMDAVQREHVTGFVRRSYDRVFYFGDEWPEQRLVVDTAEDFQRVRGVIEKMTRPHTEYGWRECLALLR